MLFERGIPFRHDWEAVLTPVVDVLVTRPDVDATACSATRSARAATGSRGRWRSSTVSRGRGGRGVVDVARAWNDNLPPELLALLRAGDRDGVVEAITTPLLVLDPEDEQFFPGQPQELYDRLPGEKEIVRFTREQGANFHCQPLARGLVGHVMCDFLADHLARVREISGSDV